MGRLPRRALASSDRSADRVRGAVLGEAESVRAEDRAPGLDSPISGWTSSCPKPSLELTSVAPMRDLVGKASSEHGSDRGSLMPQVEPPGLRSFFFARPSGGSRDRAPRGNLGN